MAAPDSAVPAALPPIYQALLDALDAVLEEGVPRSVIEGPDAVRQTDAWNRAFVQADAIVGHLRATPTADDISVARLIAAATALWALVRASRLRDAVAAGAFPELAALRQALDAAYAVGGERGTAGPSR